MSDKMNTNFAKHKHLPVKLPWIFPGAPLIFNGASRNIQGNLDRYANTKLIFFQSINSAYKRLTHWGQVTHILYKRQ